MLVRELMTPNPTTISIDTSVPEALRVMHEGNFRELPVLDTHGQLAGIVSDKDLLYASPSPATSLSIWEIKDLLSKVKVEEVLIRDVQTAGEDMPVEEAARIMADCKIGSLLVMRDKVMVGIITKTDLFKAFLSMLGGRRPGVRVAAYTSGAKGTVARITNAIAALGGDIVGLGFSEVSDQSELKWEMTFKVQDVAKDKLVEVLKPLVLEIIDIREM
jgi:acetoin utilization protein AcuB